MDINQVMGMDVVQCILSKSLTGFPLPEQIKRPVWRSNMYSAAQFSRIIEDHSLDSSEFLVLIRCFGTLFIQWMFDPPILILDLANNKLVILFRQSLPFFSTILPMLIRPKQVV
jgi:hypothetical protein